MAKKEKVVEEKSRTEILLEQVLEELKSLRTQQERPVTANLAPDASFQPTNEPTPTAPEQTSYPVPVDYRGVVDSILNKSFGIEVEPHTDAPVATVSIVVPDKYSNMTPAQRELIKVDRRPKVISFAEGVNGVREWAERVYKNLNPEIQAMVVADRVRGL